MPLKKDRDYSSLDDPEICRVLFHPRPQISTPGVQTAGEELEIPVAPRVAVGACFHMTHRTNATILFFHGNGEIVADYNDLGPMYNNLGLNFLAVDYRGYGRSGGSPTASTMMADCHPIFRFCKAWLDEHSYTGPLLVMGRSLGSASAIELAAEATYPIHGLVVESGFAFTGPLLRLLGIPWTHHEFSQERDFGNLEKMKTIDVPTLVIHAENDHIIPYSEGQALYDACPAADKRLLKIENADHNSIFMVGLSKYLGAVKSLVESLSLSPGGKSVT